MQTPPKNKTGTTAATDEVLESYFATGSYQETAALLGMSYDAVRKRVKRHIPPGSSTLVKDGSIALQWRREPKGSLSGDEIASQVGEALKDYKPPAPLKRALKAPSKSLATVLPLPDLHFGLLSWHKETEIDWDLDLSRKTYIPAVEELIDGAPASDTFVVLGLGDLLHSDNYDNQTTGGTPQDQDGRHPKLLYAATQFLLTTIDLAAQKHKNVLAVVLPGNHDEQSAVGVRLALSLHYAKHKHVTVEDSANRFWYWQWGKILCAATHGDKIKKAELPLLMAQHRPQEWGATEHRVYLTGHIHHETALEKGGVRVESLQSPSAKDQWHHTHGYGAGRSLQTITLDKEGGLRSRRFVNL